jgi:hypothetical protein
MFLRCKIQIYIVLTLDINFIAHCTHLVTPFLPFVLGVEKVLVLPYLLSILVNLVFHPSLPPLQSLVHLVVLESQVIQVHHQNLDLL